MNKRLIAAAAALLVGCEGMPVKMGSDGPPPAGGGRQLTAQSCGFQLLLFIPIATNSRQYRAYNGILAQAAGDYVTDVQVTEQWYWAGGGTVYCTIIDAKAIRRV